MPRLFDPKIETHVYLNNIKYEIRDLDVEFSIEAFAGSGKKSNPNTAAISIYNLSKKTRDLFSEEHQAIEFYAGHGDDIGLIFVGQTTSVQHVVEDTFIRTDILAGDGFKEFSIQRISKSFKAGTPILTILDDLTAAFDLPVVIDPFLLTSQAGQVLLQGETYDGLVKDAMNDLCGDYTMDWSIQHGTVEVTQKDSPFLADPTAVILSADTGMVGSPEIIERTDQAAKEGKEEKKVFGVKVKSLLNPEIKPKRLVQIVSVNTTSALGQAIDGAPPIDANGVYISDVVRYSGNNFGGEFYVEMEGDIQ